MPNRIELGRKHKSKLQLMVAMPARQETGPPGDIQGKRL